jgi:hypothetical protein
MRKNRLITVALWSLSLGALAGGCAAESAPNFPTYDADVKPILESRCIRCHGAGGTLNDDPDHKGYFAGAPPVNGYFTRPEDEDCPGDAPGSKKCYGLLHYTAAGDMASADQFAGFIRATDDAKRMPPPPTPALSARQVDVFNNWLANCKPPIPPEVVGTCP